MKQHIAYKLRIYPNQVQTEQIEQTLGSVRYVHNKHFIKIDRWFPSSKLCNECGTVKDDLKVSDRIYVCDCGHSIDRDINAARNIKREGIEILVKELGVNLYQNPTVIPTESYSCGDTMTKVTRSAQELSLIKTTISFN